MNLGFLLTPFAEKIKSGIARQLSGILAAAPAINMGPWRVPSPPAMSSGRQSRPALDAI